MLSEGGRKKAFNPDTAYSSYFLIIKDKDWQKFQKQQVQKRLFAYTAAFPTSKKKTNSSLVAATLLFRDSPGTNSKNLKALPP